MKLKFHYLASKLWEVLIWFLIGLSFFVFLKSAIRIKQSFEIKNKSHSILLEQGLTNIWLNEFKYYAKKNNLNINNIDKVKVLFVSPSSDLLKSGIIGKELNLGFCGFFPEPIIILRRYDPKKFSILKYKNLFFHELAHCTYFIAHSNDPNSIMHISSLHPVVSGKMIDDVFKEKRSSYLLVRTLFFSYFFGVFFSFFLFSLLILRYKDLISLFKIK